MSDLFQEIMSDVRADRIDRLWNKYGKIVIFLALALIITTAVVVFWNNRQREYAAKYTAHYLAAADYIAQGNGKAALTELAQVETAKNSVYHSLILLKKAEASYLLGNEEEATKFLHELAGEKDIYADIGNILLSENQPADKIITDNKAPEKAKDSPLQLTLDEWKAWQLLASKDYAAAAAKFESVANQLKIPDTMRERAQMMALYLHSTKNDTKK